MKPHEEEWELTTSVPDTLWVAGDGGACLAEFIDATEEQRRLIRAAPMMARALLAVLAESHDARGNTWLSVTTEAALLRALREAGVLP